MLNYQRVQLIFTTSLPHTKHWSVSDFAGQAHRMSNLKSQATAFVVCSYWEGSAASPQTGVAEIDTRPMAMRAMLIFQELGMSWA